MAPLPLTDALTEGRERTLALVEPLSDADIESQHVEIMSPLVWDLAHIAAYEELWLVHREAGRRCRGPRSPRCTTRSRRHAPCAATCRCSIASRRSPIWRTCAVASLTHDGFIPELVLRHEHQHGETMLQTIELARLSPAPARAALPARCSRWPHRASRAS